MKHLRLWCLMLVVVMLLGCFAACTPADQPDPEDPKDSDVTDPSDDPNQEDPNQDDPQEDEMEDLPEQLIRDLHEGPGPQEQGCQDYDIQQEYPRAPQELIHRPHSFLFCHYTAKTGRTQ